MKPIPSVMSKRALSVGKQKDEDSVIYEDVFDNFTDIVYTFTYDGVKEDIVLEKYNGKNTFDFEVITGGLSLEEEKGALLLKDENGEVKATMGEIVIFSADNKNNTFGEYKITEKQKSNSYIITVCVDVAYLTSPDTKYPVTIDPPTEITGSSGIEDMQVFKGTDGSGASETSAGKSGVSRVGWTDWGACRTLMRFTTLNLEDAGIKYATQIEEAYIGLRDLMCQGGTYLPVVCSQFTGNSWKESETRTWNSLNAGKSGISSPVVNVTYNNGAKNTPMHWYKWDITKIAKKWVGNTDCQQKGVVFRTVVPMFEDSSTYAQYMKTFSSMQGNKIYMPYLCIKFSLVTPVSAASFSYTSLTLDVGKTHTFYPKVYPSDATNQQFTWTSSNTAVATVSSSGMVTAKAVGTATITAQSKDNPSAKATCKVTVKEKDSDGDGLSDTIEKQLGTNQYKRDTDGDGYDDKHDSTKLTPSVKKTMLKGNYISVRYDTSENDNLESWDNQGSKISYGGNQSWFYNDEFNLGNLTIQESGCGLIAVCDTLLYLSERDTIQIPYKVNHSAFDENEIINGNHSSLDCPFTLSSYMEYVTEMELLWFNVVNNIGLNGIDMADNINKLSNGQISANWQFVVPNGNNIDPKFFNTALFEQIIDMIENDIPVILSIGPFSSKIAFYKLDESDNCKPNYKVDQYVKGHYVTVTGIIVDSETNKWWMKISSWGQEYYIDFSEYSSQIDPLTNILCISKG